jgi:CRP-like cAMP-binding protein
MIANARPAIATTSTPMLGPDPRIERFRSLVGQSPLFRGASGQALDDLMRRMQIRSRPASTVLVAQDEPGDSMFLLVEGRARVVIFGENGRELTLSSLRPGDVFGELSLLDARPRSANVVAVDDVIVLSLGRESFASHIQRFPQTALNLASELGRRLRRADEQIAALGLQDVETRLVHLLERLANEDGERQETGLLLRRRPTQQELANMVGSCRETISRTFAAMVRRGLLVPRGRALLLTDKLIQKAPVPVAAAR